MDKTTDILTTTFEAIWKDNIKIIISIFTTIIIWIISERSLNVWIEKSIQIKVKNNYIDKHLIENEITNKTIPNSELKDEKKIPKALKIMSETSEQQMNSIHLENDYFQSKLKYKNK